MLCAATATSMQHVQDSMLSVVLPITDHEAEICLAPMCIITRWWGATSTASDHQVSLYGTGAAASRQSSMQDWLHSLERSVDRYMVVMSHTHCAVALCLCRKPKYDLDKIPGPWHHAKPVVGNILECLRPDFHRKLLDWSNTYGGIYRLKFL